MSGFAICSLKIKKRKTRTKKKLAVVQANQTFGKIGFQLNVFTF